jgi:hypothetical protein
MLEGAPTPQLPSNGRLKAQSSRTDRVHYLQRNEASAPSGSEGCKDLLKGMRKRLQKTESDRTQSGQS